MPGNSDGEVSIGHHVSVRRGMPADTITSWREASGYSLPAATAPVSMPPSGRWARPPSAAYGMHVIGFYDGFLGLMQNRFVRFDSDSLSGILTRGGTVLGDQPGQGRQDGDGRRQTHGHAVPDA